MNVSKCYSLNYIVDDKEPLRVIVCYNQQQNKKKGSLCSLLFQPDLVGMFIIALFAFILLMCLLYMVSKPIKCCRDKTSFPVSFRQTKRTPRWWWHWIRQWRWQHGVIFQWFRDWQHRRNWHRNRIVRRLCVRTGWDLIAIWWTQGVWFKWGQ